ncbi:MAG TPA: hypothetical protein PLG34_00570 [Spirochaetota bacterium]|nr:hypothetical protein [Spirochaetota bacterium]
MLYFFCYREFIVLTNKFTKNAEKVPENEIARAIKMKDKFMKKYTNYEKLLEEYNENA